jgi:hypothetical protein
VARSISTRSGEPAKEYSRGSCSGIDARDVSDDFVRVTRKPEVNFSIADYSSRMLESAAHRRTADSESLGVMRSSKVAKAPMREAPQSTLRCLTLIDVPS